MFAQKISILPYEYKTFTLFKKHENSLKLCMYMVIPCQAIYYIVLYLYPVDNLLSIKRTCMQPEM